MPIDELLTLLEEETTTLGECQREIEAEHDEAFEAAKTVVTLYSDSERQDF